MLLLACLALAAAGCSTTAGVTRVGLRDAYSDINVNALNTREASEDSKVVLHRYDLVERFDRDPEAVLAILRDKGLGDDDRRDLLHSAYEEVEVNNRKVPLETDSTAPLAYSLEDPFVWNAGVKRFLKVEARIDPGTSLFQPYLPGRIPVARRRRRAPARRARAGRGGRTRETVRERAGGPSGSARARPRENRSRRRDP